MYSNSQGLATLLSIDHPLEWISWIEFESRLFYATQPAIVSNPSAPPVPFSSVTGLIQGIYSEFPDQARKICRSRIFSTQPTLTPFCRGMIRVAAKRVTLVQASEVFERIPKLDVPAIDLSHSDPLSKTFPSALFAPQELRPPFSAPHSASTTSELAGNHAPLEHWFDLARDWVPKLPQNTVRHLSDRPILAFLLSPCADGTNYQLLAATRNLSSQNRTLHAEVNLIQSWHQAHGTPLPEPAVIVTSLKPCRMCAGLIWQSSQNKSAIQVYYLENDPGPHAQNTALEAFSADRKLATQNEDELGLVTLFEARVKSQ